MDMEKYMREALELAREAADHGEIPVGCVVVDPQGQIIGRGRNRRQEELRVSAHAEMDALDQAAQALGDWRLDGCALFVTLEPCPMCAGAMINARISTLVYGAREGLTGSCASVLNLFEERYPSKPAIYGGVLEAECAGLLREFFQALRNGSSSIDQ
jgi:tRNA(adenine34) deaminase